MSSTKKLDVSKLKPGMQFKVPAQTVTVRLLHKIDAPTLEDNLYILQVSGNKGPFKGKMTDITAWSGDKVELILKQPPLRRLVDAVIKWVWGSKS
jgi:hypothetical protein